MMVLPEGTLPLRAALLGVSARMRAQQRWAPVMTHREQGGLQVGPSRPCCGATTGSCGMALAAACPISAAAATRCAASYLYNCTLSSLGYKPFQRPLNPTEFASAVLLGMLYSRCSASSFSGAGQACHREIDITHLARMANPGSGTTCATLCRHANLVRLSADLDSFFDGAPTQGGAEKVDDQEGPATADLKEDFGAIGAPRLCCLHRRLVGASPVPFLRLQQAVGWLPTYATSCRASSYLRYTTSPPTSVQ